MLRSVPDPDLPIQFSDDAKQKEKAAKLLAKIEDSCRPRHFVAKTRDPSGEWVAGTAERFSLKHIRRKSKRLHR